MSLWFCNHCAKYFGPNGICPTCGEGGSHVNDPVFQPTGAYVSPMNSATQPTPTPEPTEGLYILCDYCLQPLKQAGGLQFGPPDVEGKCEKIHVCCECWPHINHVEKFVAAATAPLKERIAELEAVLSSTARGMSLAQEETEHLRRVLKTANKHEAEARAAIDAALAAESQTGKP